MMGPPALAFKTIAAYPWKSAGTRESYHIFASCVLRPPDSLGEFSEDVFYILLFTLAGTSGAWERIQLARCQRTCCPCAWARFPVVTSK